MLTTRHNDNLILSNGGKIIAPRVFELDGYRFYMHINDFNYGAIWCDLYIYLTTDKNDKKVITYRGSYKIQTTNKGLYIYFRSKRIYICD